MIQDELILSENPTKDLIEASIRNSGESNFTFSGFLSNLDKDELDSIVSIINEVGLNSSDFFDSNNIKITENKHAIIPQLASSGDILELFHNQAHLRQRFTNWVTPKIAQATFIGDPKSEYYVRFDSEVSENFLRLKQDAFKELITFLKETKVNGNNLLGSSDNFKLFLDGGAVNYTDYVRVMKIAANYFLDSGQFKKTKSYVSEKEFPLMSYDLESSNDSKVVKAYFNTILLNNFDFIINQLGTGVIIDFNYLGSFNSNSDLVKNPKYRKKIKGLHTDYWSAEDHESEGSEAHEDDLTKMIVSSIPSYRKDGETIDGMMEVKQIYLLGARIYKFELENYRYLKNTFENFVPFNQDSIKALDFYIDIISNPKNKGPKFEKLFEIKEILLSLKNFFENNNIMTKELNSSTSLKSIITQVINNNRGAVYSVYNANGKLDIKEMTNFDYQVTAFSSWTFNKLSSNLKEEYDTEGKAFNEVDALFSEKHDDSLSNLSVKSRKQISDFFRKKFGNGLGEDAFDLMISDMKSSREGSKITFETVGDLKLALLKLLDDAHASHDGVLEAKDSENRVFGDSSVNEYIEKITKNPLFIAYRNGWLENYVVKPQMNIETLTGEKIPTFKIANLTYKDLELFEVYDLNKRSEDKFKSILAEGDGENSNIELPLIGTQTKLEAVSPDKSRNKSAGKFNVTESFKSNFMFDFLKQLAFNDSNKRSSFGVMLGNYSDKGTILLKTIDASYIHRGEKVISKDDKDLKELVRTQGFNFYNDSVNSVISDYSKMFDTLLIYSPKYSPLALISEKDLNTLKSTNRESTSKEVINAFNIIDSVFAKLTDNGISIYDLNAEYASYGNNSPLMEELHYSSYSDVKLSTNRQLLSSYVIFSSPSNFNKFAERVESKFISDYNELIDDKNELELPEDIASEISSLVKPENLNVKLGKFKTNSTLKISIKGELNPLLKKWMWLNALYRNEYLFISAKGEFMHPHKNKSTYISDIDVSKDDFWNKYEFETSGRTVSMAKRNVMFTATIETPVRDSKLGVPDKVNHAVIKDYTDSLINISGKINSRQEVHDGSSFIDYVYSKLVDASYPGKGYDGTKKPFGTFITPNGVVIKKDAESVISNWNILASNKSTISLKNKKRQMLGLNINNQRLSSPFSLNVEHDDYYYKSGNDLIKILDIRLDNAESGKIGYTIRTKNITKKQKSVTSEFKQLDNLYELWEAFGAEYSTDSEGEFNEGSNELLYRIVTSVKNNLDKYFLKDYIIHIISNGSAVKAGGMGVNPADSWRNNSRLSYSSHESRFLGPQLDANHEADESKIKEITQVISALAQSRDTAVLAEEAYSDIAKVIENSAEKYSSYIRDWSQNPQETKRELYSFLAKKFVKDIQSAKGDTIAKILTQSLSNVSELPFSNQNFFTGFVRSIITDLNNNFISRYYSGTGAILIPSHGIIQLYDVPVKDKAGNIVSYRTVMHNDLVKEALNSGIEGTNEEIINNYIETLLADSEISADKIEFGDTIRIKLSEEEQSTILDGLDLEFANEEQASFMIASALNNESIVTLNTPEKYYKFKENIGNQIITKVNSKPRELKPSTFIWTTLKDNEFVQSSAFDLDPVKLRLKNQLGLLNNEDRLFLSEFKERFKTMSLERALLKWNQRNLQLLESGKILISLEVLRERYRNEETGLVDNVTLLSDLFGNDDLLKDFKNVKDHYSQITLSQPIFNYKANAAEMIMGDIYQSKFNRLDKDSISEIKSKGSEYFREKLIKKYDVSTEPAEFDFKITSESGESVYVQFSGNNITNDSSSIKLESKQDPLDPKNTLYFIRDRFGKEMIYINKDYVDEIKIKNEEGRIVVYFKSFDSNNRLNSNFKKMVNNFININKQSIAELIPISKIDKITKLEVINAKDGKQISRKSVNYNLTEYTQDLMFRFVGKRYTNMEYMIDDMSKKLYASWEKSHEFVAARIPSQSMQSFMPMKNVAYFKTKSNEAYVSVWQIWFQGSDFDIDKAYLLGSGFKGNSLFDTSDKFDYSSVEELNEIEKFPMPSGKRVQTIESDTAVDISEEFEKYNDHLLNKENALALNIFGKILNKLKNTNEVKLKTLNALTAVGLIEKINEYNLDKDYLRSQHHVKNSIVSKIKQIILSPSNQILATMPVDDALNSWKDAVKEKEDNDENRTIYNVSPYNMLGKFKQQYEASVGKDDVGISANGLKVFFALSNYYNKYYNSSFDESKINLDNHTFVKSFKINGTDYNIGTVSDIGLSDLQKGKLIEILGLNEDSFRNSDAAMFLSGFTSAATDNAKELLMAKVNASVQLASMHIYLMILGFTPKEIVDIMTSDIVVEVINGLNDDIFSKNYGNIVPVVIENIKRKINPEDTVKIENLDAFEKIYNGSQEIKQLAKLLGINQKTSANIQEIHKFLTTFETIVFSREHILFGDDIIKIKKSIASEESVDKFNLNPIQYNKTLDSVATKLIYNSNGRFTELNKKDIISILESASRVKVEYADFNGDIKSKYVSVLGGEFDYRYYIHPTNDEYREVTKQYYNLIKDTFNIFDVIDNVPHFKQMIGSLIMSHQLLNISSIKYSTSFNLLKDLTRKFGSNLKIEANPDVKYINANSGLPIRIGDSNFNGVLLYIDSILKESWLKQSKFGKDVTFNTASIKKYMALAGVKTFNVYTSDEAYKYPGISQASVVAQINTDKKDTVDEDFTIDLQTTYGIANFKNFMEKVLLGVLSNNGPIEIKELLKVGSVRNLFGLNGSAIIPSFRITDKNTPASAEKILKLNKAFNDLDLDTSERLKLEAGMNWRHLFFIYNLLVNNEKYGDKRLTPILEDYMKEPTSAAADFIRYSYLLDSGQIPIFDIDKSLVSTDNKTDEEINKEAEEIQARDVLYYAYGKKGFLGYIGKDSTSVKNSDFPLLYGLTIEKEVKRDNQEWQILRNLLSKNNFLIQFKCD